GPTTTQPTPTTQPVTPGSPVSTLSVNGAEVPGAINVPGKVDTYTFEVNAGNSGFINIVTSGNTRLKLTLFDANQLQLETTEGSRETIDFFNSNIVRQLSPGKYTVRVQHRSATGIGKAYGIRVSRGL